jgi:hypothetical protein
MGRWVSRVFFLFAAISCLAFNGAANAQASRTWVSGVGDDVNPCSRTAPCKTFAGAISKTAVLGEINCLDPAGYGAVTITKSITIDCSQTFGSILNAGTNGIVIAFDSFTDARKTVRLRNLSFNGVDTGQNGIRIIGAAGSSGSEVFVEKCVIDGDFAGNGRGISDERSGGGELYVTDTVVRNMGGTGIAVAQASGSTRIDVIVDNSSVLNSNNGLVVVNGVKAMVSRSIFSGNTVAGVFGNTGAELNLSNSVSSGNGTGVIANGTVRLSNNDIAFNAAGFSGTAQSFGNNRISSNTTAGPTPTLIGANSPPFGQQ